VSWNASEFWVDGGCRSNQAHGKRKAYGSIIDCETVERVQFANAQTNNEAKYMALSVLLGNLLSNRVDARNPQTSIYTDSQLAVSELTQGSKVKVKNLLALHDEAALRLRRTGAKPIWVPQTQIVR
jgi:ribonuclease HI